MAGRWGAGVEVVRKCRAGKHLCPGGTKWPRLAPDGARAAGVGETWQIAAITAVASSYHRATSVPPPSHLRPSSVPSPYLKRRKDGGRTEEGRRKDGGRTEVGRRWDGGGTEVGSRWDGGGTEVLSPKERGKGELDSCRFQRVRISEPEVHLVTRLRSASNRDRIIPALGLPKN